MIGPFLAHSHAIILNSVCQFHKYIWGDGYLFCGLQLQNMMGGRLQDGRLLERVWYIFFKNPIIQYLFACLLFIWVGQWGICLVHDNALTISSLYELHKLLQHYAAVLGVKSKLQRSVYYCRLGDMFCFNRNPLWMTEKGKTDIGKRKMLIMAAFSILSEYIITLRIW